MRWPCATPKAPHSACAAAAHSAQASVGSYLLGSDALACGEHLDRAPLGDQPWQALRAAAAGQQPEPHLPHAELRGADGDADVGGDGLLEAAAVGVAVDAADHDLLHLAEVPPNALARRFGRGGVGLVQLVDAAAGEVGLDVRAGAEGALPDAREDGDVQLRVCVELLEGLADLGVGVEVARLPRRTRQAGQLRAAAVRERRSSSR